MALDIVINLFIFFYTFYAVVSYFRSEGHWDKANGLKALRFFTNLSNLFCAVAALLVVLTNTAQGLAYWAWILKYIGTAAVIVTFLTVLFFLGPAIGYKELLSGKGFYLHLCGPLLALLSFCFLERAYELSFSLSLIGCLPVILYGFVYLYEVVIWENWEDFYGYNKDGKWPISMAAMFIGGFLVCILIRLLYNLG